MLLDLLAFKADLTSLPPSLFPTLPPFIIFIFLALSPSLASSPVSASLWLSQVPGLPGNSRSGVDPRPATVGAHPQAVGSSHHEVHDAAHLPPHCLRGRSVSVWSTSSQPHGLQPTSLLCPWDCPAKNTGVGCHFLLQGIFQIQGLNPFLLRLLPWQEDSSSVKSFKGLTGSSESFP